MAVRDLTTHEDSRNIARNPTGAPTGITADLEVPFRSENLAKASTRESELRTRRTDPCTEFHMPKPGPQRVNLITLGVEDLANSREFYARLGWKPAEDLPNVTFYRMRGCMLGLFGKEALADDQGRPGTPLGTGAMTLAQNFPSEGDVDQAFAKAVAAGATPLKAPEKVFWGGYSGYFADPDGHVWELAFNPFWPLDEDGFLAETDPAQKDE